MGRGGGARAEMQASVQTKTNEKTKDQVCGPGLTQKQRAGVTQSGPGLTQNASLSRTHTTVVPPFSRAYARLKQQGMVGVGEGVGVGLGLGEGAENENRAGGSGNIDVQVQAGRGSEA